MERYPLKNAVNVCHALLLPYVPAAAVLVDMTCGNGGDTAFLAAHMSQTACLYAFDIQACAVAATKKKLQEQQLLSDRIRICQGSHEKLLALLEKQADVIVFNLGYLPKGNHSFHTKTEITVEAVKIGLHKLAKNGIIMIAAYPGTDYGAGEAQAVRAYVERLPQQKFDVSLWQPVNQVHCPPQLYIVQKRG